MKTKKIMFNIVFATMLVLGLVNLSFAISNTTDDRAYWTLNNTLTDLINGINWVAADATLYQTGILNTSLNFDGVNDYFETDSNPYDINNTDFSISLWAYPTSSANNVPIISNRYALAGGNNYVYMYMDTTRHVKVKSRDTAQLVSATTNTLTLNTWNHIVLARNGTTCTVWINNVSEVIGCVQNDISMNNNWALGANTDVGSDFPGRIDEIFITSYKMVHQNVSDLYNSGAPNSSQVWPFVLPPAPPGNVTLTYNNIRINNNSITALSYWNDTTIDFYTNITNTSTNGNVNNTFNLYDGTNALINSTQYSTNSLSGSFTTLPLTDDIYKIFFYAENNETNVTSSNYTFYIDTTPPVIQQIANISNNTFSVNFGNILNVTDNLSGLSTCFLNITELENVSVPDNFYINCTDTQVFTSAGLHNGLATATDKAGNVNTYSFNFTIIPLVYISFENNLTNASINDYIVTIFHPDGRVSNQTDINGSIQLSPVNNGSLDLGIHTLEFNKQGYVITNYTFNINSSSGDTNYTFKVNPVTLSIKMFDAAAVSNQLAFNITIINSTSSAVFTNQINFSKQYTQIPHGNINIVIESVGYSNSYFYQTILPYTSISIVGYMIDINSTTVVTFSVVDRASEQALEDVIVEAQELINGTYTTVSQGQTDISGTTFIFLDVSKVYKFIFTKSSYVSAVATAIPGTTEYKVRLEEEGSQFEFIDGISYSLTPTLDVLYDQQNYTFKGFISGTGITLVNYTIRDQTGAIIYTAISTNPTGTTFSYTINNFNATLYTSINQTLTYYANNNVNTFTKTYKTTAIGINSFIYYLKYDFAQADSEDNNIFKWIMMTVSIGASFLVGRAFSVNLLGNSINVIVVSGFFTYINWMPEVYFGAISVVALTLWASGGIIK